MKTGNDSVIDTISKGVIGTCSPILGVLTSQQEQLEYWLRISALVLGVAVSLVTLVSLIKKMPK